MSTLGSKVFPRSCEGATRTAPPEVQVSNRVPSLRKVGVAAFAHFNSWDWQGTARRWVIGSLDFNTWALKGDKPQRPNNTTHTVRVIDFIENWVESPIQVGKEGLDGLTCTTSKAMPQAHADHPRRGQCLSLGRRGRVGTVLVLTIEHIDPIGKNIG